MLSWLGSLFSQKGIIEAGINGADKLHFGDQERAEFLLKYLQASAPMAITRRVIACMVAALWCLGVVVAGVLFYTDQAQFRAWGGFMSETVNGPFSVIMAFYFLAHVVRANK